MIWDSNPWKRELARRAESLKNRSRQRRWSSAASAKTELDVFLSAYAMRKLLESRLISDEVEHSSVEGLAYEPTGRVVDIQNWDKIDELYDLSKARAIRVSLRTFCDQIVHIFVFVPRMNERGRLDGVFLASDRERLKRLMYFGISDVVGALLRVAQDDIVYAESRRERVGSERKIVRKSNRFPEAR